MINKTNAGAELLYKLFNAEITYKQFAAKSCELAISYLENMANNIDDHSTSLLPMSDNIDIATKVTELETAGNISGLLGNSARVLVEYNELCKSNPKQAYSMILPAIEAFTILWTACGSAGASKKTIGKLVFISQKFITSRSKSTKNFNYMKKIFGNNHPDFALKCLINKTSRALDKNAPPIAGLFPFGNIVGVTNCVLIEEVKAKHTRQGFLKRIFSKKTNVNESNLYTVGHNAAENNNFHSVQQDSRGTKELNQHMLDVLEEMRQLKEQIARLEGKVDNITESIRELLNDVKAVKHNPDPVEEKLALLHFKIDELTKVNRQVADYTAKIIAWLENYNFEKLYPSTKEFLVQAESLIEHLDKLQADDYSILIVQLSRALESELLQKIYVNYAKSILTRELDLSSLFATDLQQNNKNNQNSAYRIAKSIKYFVDRNCEVELRLTLGAMETGISFALDETMRTVSGFACDFHDYLIRTLEADICTKTYVDKLDEIRIEYRNKAAHDGVFGRVLADKGRICIRGALRELLEACPESVH